MLKPAAAKFLITALVILSGILVIAPSYDNAAPDNREFLCAKIMQELQTALEKFESDRKSKLTAQGERINVYSLLSEKYINRWSSCTEKPSEYPYSVSRADTRSDLVVKCKFHGTIANAKRLAENRLKQKDDLFTIQRYVGYSLIVGGLLIFFLV